MGVKPGGWATNDVPTATEINSYFQQRDAWDSWTPTWTNLTVGNGTVVARYNQVGRIVHFYLQFTFQSTSSVSGAVAVTLPVARAGSSTPRVYFDCDAEDNGTGYVAMRAVSQATTTVNLYSINTPTMTAMSSTSPFTWTTLDSFTISGTYEAASAP